MDQERLQRMKKVAVYELLHYYDKDEKQKWKDRLKRAAGRYVPPEDNIFWDTGLLANGLMELLWIHRRCAGKEGDAEDRECEKDRNDVENKKRAEGSGIIGAVRQYFDRWISRGMPVYYVDDTLCGVALLRLYEMTSEEKYKAGADRLADYLLVLGEKEADAAGSIPYRPKQKNGHVYVDGIGMMCPFLAMYGVKYGNRAAVELALTQIKNMLAYGMDAKSGLPYHGFQYEKKEKYGIIGWGRAVGWFLMGMQGVLYWLKEGKEAGACGSDNDVTGGGGRDRKGTAQEDLYHAEYSELKRAFADLLEAVRPYQREDGGFSWQLEALEGPADSSATAMIARALQFGVECGWDMSAGTGQGRAAGTGKMSAESIGRGNMAEIDKMRENETGASGMENEGAVEVKKEENAAGSEEDGKNWQSILRDAANFLDASEKDGKIYNCLGECMGFSQYPQVYGAYPWALGVALEVKGHAALRDKLIGL